EAGGGSAGSGHTAHPRRHQEVARRRGQGRHSPGVRRSPARSRHGSSIRSSHASERRRVAACGLDANALERKAQRGRMLNNRREARGCAFGHAPVEFREDMMSKKTYLGGGAALAIALSALPAAAWEPTKPV